MSACIAVVSLKENLKRLKNPSTDPEITTSAYGTLESLKYYLRSKTLGSVAIGAVEAEIRDAAWKLEDAVDVESLTTHSKGLEEEIHSFIETVEILIPKYLRVIDDMLEEEEEEEEKDGDFGEKKSTRKTVGLYDGQPEKIINELIGAGDRVKTITHVGMAGIGKSHFVREIYHHPEIVEHFDIRVWVRVGQKGRADKVFNDIVAQIEPKARDLGRDKFTWEDYPVLGYFLFGRRCLIVLDDIWDRKVVNLYLEKLREAGVRRILRTSRVYSEYESHDNQNYHIRFLNSEESWNLLWQNVFVDESSFPAELEIVGRKIAEICEGLPLLILTVADILRGVQKTEEYWNKVANRKTATFVDAYELISKVLMSSYEYLYEDLKAFFLYMGVFPPSYEIRASKLLNLWYVENFLDPPCSSNIEGYFHSCLGQLVSNSVVIACKQSYDGGETKSCKLHSAYWYLSVQKARKNKFFHVLNKLTDCSEECIQGQRRLSVQNSVLFGIEEARAPMEAAGTKARSLLCTGKYHEYPVSICLNATFLKVLDAISVRLYEFPEEVVKLLLLRYLALTHTGKLPSSISNLGELEFLILRQHHNVNVLRNPTFLPEAIWEMQQLIHLQITGHNIPDPSNAAELPNLQTLYVSAHSCTEAVLSALPNLTKLGIRIELRPDADADADAAETMSCFQHIELLDELESLKCVVVNPQLGSHSHIVAPPHGLPNLPRWLKKLSLSGLGYSWEHITAVGSLPQLEILKLRSYAFRGRRWELNAGEFPSLEYLLLDDTDLVRWTTDDDDDDYCLPRLQSLNIRRCYKLKQIPGLFDSKTLQIMEVVDCSPSFMDFALQIQNLEKPSLQVVISSSWIDD